MTRDRGEQLAVEYGIKFMETSAKASINVDEAFFTLARDIKCKMEKRMVSIFVYQGVGAENKLGMGFIALGKMWDRGKDWTWIFDGSSQRIPSRDVEL